MWSSRITSIESSIATCMNEKSDCFRGTVGADEGIKLCSLLQIFQDINTFCVAAIDMDSQPMTVSACYDRQLQMGLAQ